MNGKFKLRFFTLFSIVMLCIGLTYKELQNDTFYIIKLGGDILKNGVDLIDHYCWVADLTYTYPHWLYDLFMYIIYDNFDFLGVYISSIILFIILILSVYIINLKTNKNEFMAFLISIISVACLYGFATARAQLVTAILFLWQVFFSEKIISCGKKKYIIYLSLISLLVANIHATIWPFYFILYLPFFAEHFIYKFINWKKFEINKKLIIDKVDNFKLLVISFISGIFMGFLSPSRICFTYIFKVMQGNSQNVIIEHAPMVVIKYPCFIIFVLVLLLILIFSKTKIKLKDLFMLSGLILMSLFSVRHVALFYIIGVFYLSIFTNNYLIDKNDKTLDILGCLMVKNKIVYLLLMIIVIIFSYSKFQKNMKQDYVSIENYPVEAVKYIKDNMNINDLKLYNNYNFGSYLLFNDIPVFIDSRCDLYLKEFNGLDYSIFDDANKIVSNYEKKFKFYNVSHVLISKNDILFLILRKDKNYQIIFEDDNFVLFEVIKFET